MMAEKSPEQPARATRGCAIALIVFVAMAAATVVGLGFNRDEFLVVEGYYCDGCIIRWRKCMGLQYESDVRGGVEARCIGIPVGPWHCLKVIHDHPYVPIPCPP